MARLFPCLMTAAAFAVCSVSPGHAYDRIISLYAGHTDNLIALGAERKLAGVTKNYGPAELPGLPRVPSRPGAEALLALRPDLVIMRTLTEKQLPALKDTLTRAGVAVRVIDPPDWKDFPGYLAELAPLADVSPGEAAGRFALLCKTLRETASSHRGGRPAPSVLVEATGRELHTCSPESWAAHLIELCGGDNAAKSATPTRRGSAVAPWGAERTLQAIAKGLQIYLIQQGPMNGTDSAALKKRPWSAALSRVRTVFIPEDELSRPSLLSLQRGGERLIHIFYGE